MNNKLYCTFTTLNEVDNTISNVKKSYVILFNKKGHISVGPYKITKEQHPKIHAQKLFNYYIQATETYTNIEIIKIIQDYLKDKKTKLFLYIYDAFIFDVSKLDGKQTLIYLKNILSDKFPVKLKSGKHYGALS